MMIKVSAMHSAYDLVVSALLVTLVSQFNKSSKQDNNKDFAKTKQLRFTTKMKRTLTVHQYEQRVE